MNWLENHQAVWDFGTGSLRVQGRPLPVHRAPTTAVCRQITGPLIQHDICRPTAEVQPVIDAPGALAAKEMSDDDSSQPDPTPAIRPGSPRRKYTNSGRATSSAVSYTHLTLP